MQPRMTRTHVPSSTAAAALKLRARESVQPPSTQLPSSTWHALQSVTPCFAAAESKLSARGCVQRGLKTQLPSSTVALALKFAASACVQPERSATQLASSCVARASKLEAALSVQPSSANSQRPSWTVATVSAAVSAAVVVAVVAAIAIVACIAAVIACLLQQNRRVCACFTQVGARDTRAHDSRARVVVHGSRIGATGDLRLCARNRCIVAVYDGCRAAVLGRARALHGLRGELRRGRSVWQQRRRRRNMVWRRR
eukprot:4861105-Pleurochrysis_carterae.AAC.2